MPTAPGDAADFQELDHRHTPMGEISLRRRREPSLQVDVYEAKLGNEFLMSSLFTAAEQQLATLALAKLPGADLDVVVGGLGLGYTARAALQDPRVRTVVVIEALAAVIDWHHRRLLPLSAELTTDPRCHLVHGDFFANVTASAGLGPVKRCHAVLVDIDHTPQHLLHPSHAAFYTVEGLRSLVRYLHPGGVFALWSDDPPDEDFLAVVRQVFAASEAEIVTFPNPHTGADASATIYLGEASRE